MPLPGASPCLFQITPALATRVERPVLFFLRTPVKRVCLVTGAEQEWHSSLPCFQVARGIGAWGRRRAGPEGRLGHFTASQSLHPRPYMSSPLCRLRRIRAEVGEQCRQGGSRGIKSNNIQKKLVAEEPTPCNRLLVTTADMKTPP